MRDDFLVFGRPSIGEAEIAEVGRLASIGLDRHRAEGSALRAHARGVRRRAARALRLVVHGRAVPRAQVLEIGPGDEVLVPAMTFVASANAVEHAGATPVLVDSEPGHGTDRSRRAPRPRSAARTKAIMPVHLAGRPLDMDAAQRDSRPSRPPRDRGRCPRDRRRMARAQASGSFGNLTAYSFYVTKNITTIEGGALATDDPELAERVERLALHGLSLGAWQRFSDSGFRHYDVERARLQVQHDRRPGGARHPPAAAPRRVDRRARAELWAPLRRAARGAAARDAAAAGDETRHARHLYQVLVSSESQRRHVTSCCPS